MTKEELIRAWSKICYCCSYSSVDYPTKELDMISDVLIAYEENQAITDKTSDKCRWHDLRKNPNDLPALGKKVVGYFENYGTWTIGIVHRHENGWRVEEFWLEGWELLAWKEIEPFEVSE